MKRTIFTALPLLAMLVVTTGTIFAEGRVLELREVRNDTARPTFVFRVIGEFSKEELNNGFVQVEGGDGYPLFCSQADEETVICNTSKEVGGRNVVIGFGGSEFWHKVPDARGPAGGRYCYPVYDWNGEEPPTGWDDFATNCQDEPAQVGQSVYLYNPLYGSTDYFYFPDGTCGACGWPDHGEGFYYPVCVSES